MKHITQEDFNSQIQSFNSAFYTKFLPQKSVVYDLGAYKGVLSIEFAKLGYIVISVEGSPRNFSHLQENTSEYLNVKCLHYALAEHTTGECMTRFNDCIGLEHPLQKVNYISLLDLIKNENLPIPKLIKMDIEGMESVVLKSCFELFRDYRPIIQLSVHDTYEHSKMCVYSGFPGFVNSENGGFNFNNFFSLGYRAFDLNMREVQHIGGFNEFFLIPKELLS